MDLDLGAVRAFLAVVDDGHFTDAADSLDMTQQAVSKRIARLESSLGVSLLNRSRAGATPTEDGAAFLTHARALISLADQATAMLRGRRRALRIDVLASVAAPVGMVRAFYEASDVDVDIVVSRGNISQRAALADGSVDVAFGRPRGPLPPGIARIPACLEPIPILVGRRHRLARRRSVPMKELSGLTAWMPGNTGDSEWADYYRLLSAEFGIPIDSSGPVFGGDHIMETIAASRDLVTFATTRQFPAHPDVIQIAVVDPTPVYPWSLMWHEANRHPSLPLLIAHVQARHPAGYSRSQWMPAADRSLFH
jgi:DNA-binding transcriptional LysR family regulator